MIGNLSSVLVRFRKKSPAKGGLDKSELCIKKGSKNQIGGNYEESIILYLHRRPLDPCGGLRDHPVGRERRE